MRTNFVITVIMMFWAAGTLQSAQQLLLDDPRIQALSSKDDNARAKASGNLIEAGAESLPSLLSLLDKGDQPASKMAYETVMRLAYSSAGTNRQQDIARALAKELNAKHSVSTRRTICRALSFVGGDESIEELNKALDNEQVREMALFALSRIPTDGAAKVLIDRLKTADKDQRIALINALGSQQNPLAAPALLKELDAADTSTCQAAGAALINIPGQAVTKQVTDSLKTTESPDKRAILLEVLGRRGERSILPVLIEAAKDKNLVVRSAALKSIGLLGADEAIDTLLAAFKDPSEAVRDAAAKAIGQLESISTTTKLLAAYKDLPEALKPAMLRIIGSRKHPDVAQLLINEAIKPKSAVREMAIVYLGAQDGLKVIMTLLVVAKEGPADITTTAIDGCLAALARLEDREPEAAGKMYLEALKLAVNQSQKRQAILGVANHIDPGQVDVLPLITPLMEAGATQKEAAVAAARFAMKLPESRKSEAINVLKRVVAIRPDEDILRKAIDHLKKLGVDFDPGRDFGIITNWWLIGPFPYTGGKSTWSKAFFPEQKVDLKAEQKVGGQTYKWKKFQTLDINGMIDLAREIAPKENVGAYGYAQITVDKEQTVILKLGSDDGVAVWLNGQKVHENYVERGFEVDQDRVEVKLKAGVNKLLVKVLNGGLAWQFGVRIITPDGEPLVFKQPME